MGEDSQGGSFFFFVCVFLGPNQRYMEVPRPRMESDLQLPAYATATAMWDLSHVFDLHCSSRQHQILNPLSVARDQTCILMDASQIFSAEPQEELLSYSLSFHSFKEKKIK